MKTFLNVLYRRILYKIPLKLLLVLLAIFGLLFACTKADDVSDLITTINTVDTDIGRGQTFKVIRLTDSSQYGTYCIDVESVSGILTFGFNNVLGNGDGNRSYNLYRDWGSFYACVYTNMEYIYLYNTDSSTVHIKYTLFKLNALINTSLPILTSQECQSQYSLIPISEIDSSYCQSNNLCPSSGSPSDCPNVGVSNVFINDLFHPGAFNIVMNIPEEIDWDYAYTNSGNNMNIDVVGYNVDYEKMQEIIDVQNYKPSSEELSTIISSIVPLFVPGLCIILLLYFIFRFIKKIF